MIVFFFGFGIVRIEYIVFFYYLSNGLFSVVCFKVVVILERIIYREGLGISEFWLNCCYLNKYCLFCDLVFGLSGYLGVNFYKCLSY